MSRHFCCCIPVRVAVFISSLLGFLFSVLVTGGSVFVLIQSQRDEDDPNRVKLSSENRIVLITISVLYGVVALISLFGFIGSVIRNRRLVALYSTMTIIAFLLQMASDIYFIYNLFHNPNSLQCDDGVADDKSCRDILHNVRWVIVAFLVVILLIQLYITVVINRYVRQLDEEQSYNRASRSVNSAFNMGPTGGPTYQPLGQDQDGLLAPKGSYQYSDPHNSFGSHA